MKKIKIIVADDDEDILRFIKYFLESAGYDVKTLVNGKGILEMPLLEYPDLFLLDLAMSGTDGRDICKALKANPITSHIPVIIISANPDIRQIAEDSCADDYVAKPFDIHVLLDKIKTKISSREGEAWALGAN